MRGVLNEGGLFGERQGWHLPGFDTSKWTVRDLSEGLPGGSAGIGFFVTTFDLAFPKNTDAFVSFQFETENTQAYRARLFVNGWMFGKVSSLSACAARERRRGSLLIVRILLQRVANVGPQTRFPVPPGILENNGEK